MLTVSFLFLSINCNPYQSRSHWKSLYLHGLKLKPKISVLHTQINYRVKVSRKKISFTNGQAIKGRAIKEKKYFFWRLKKNNVSMSIKLGGGKGLNGLAISGGTFFASSLTFIVQFVIILDLSILLYCSLTSKNSYQK